MRILSLVAIHRPRGLRAKFVAPFFALALLGALSSTSAGQIEGTGAIFPNQPPAPFGNIDFYGYAISWMVANCQTWLDPFDEFGSYPFSNHTWNTVWKNTTPGLPQAIFQGGYASHGGIPSPYIISDDKRYKWINPTLQVECIEVQYKATIVATQSWIVVLAHSIRGSEGGVVEPVTPPTAHFTMSSDGGGPVTDSDEDELSAGDGDILALSSSAQVDFDGSLSFPGDTTITDYNWAIDGSSGYDGEYQTLFFEPGSYVVTLTVTDALDNTGSASGTVSVETGDDADYATGAGSDQCWDVYYVTYNTETGEIYSETYLYSFCCDAEGCYQE